MTLRRTLSALLLAAALVSPVRAADVPPMVEIVDTWNGHPVRMLGGLLRVQLRPGAGRDVAAAAQRLPDMTVVGQILAPERTLLYGSGFRKALPSPAERRRMVAEEALVRTFTVRYDGPLRPMAAAAALMAKHPDVAWAEPWYIDDVHAAPNDPLLSQQTYLSVVRAVEAWEVSSGSASTLIGISDNGVDQTHEDIVGSLATNTGEIPDNGIDDDANGYVDDYQGYNFAWQQDGSKPGETVSTDDHGLSVAGLAGATWNNGKGIAGLGGRSKLVPIKTSVRGISGIVFGYASILYAADRGVSVLNTSWGSVKPYSPVDQAIIDLATSRGVMIVASAGNHGNRSGYEPTDRNYPSAYRHVTGVGEVNTSDIVAVSSGLGTNADILAPATNALTTSAGGQYGTFGIVGTSFAAPMVTGMAAIVRARHPDLVPEQVAAFVRRCVVDVAERNPDVAAGLPGRMDMLAAVTAAPLETAGLDIDAAGIVDTEGGYAASYALGVPQPFALDCINYLRPCPGVTIRLRTLAANGWDVEWVDAEDRATDIATLGTVRLDGYTVNVRTQGPKAMRVLCTMEYDDGTVEERVVMLERSNGMVTMRNEAIVYGIGDRGAFGAYGRADDRTGAGFVLLPTQGLLAPSGLVVTAGTDRCVIGRNDVGTSSDFSVVTPFAPAGGNRAVMNDANAPVERRIGIEATVTCRFPNASEPSTILDVELRNVSGTTLQDVAAGFVMDWDMGYSGERNTSRLAPDALPAGMDDERSSVQLFERAGFPVALAYGVTTDDSRGVAQSGAATYNDVTQALTSATETVALFSSGQDRQTNVADDLMGIGGMRFPGAMAPGATYRFVILIGASTSSAGALGIIRNRLAMATSVRPVPAGVPPLTVTPNPADAVVDVSVADGTVALDIVDALGRRMDGGLLMPPPGYHTVPVATWAPGIYHCRITGPTWTRTVSFVVRH